MLVLRTYPNRYKPRAFLYGSCNDTCLHCLVPTSFCLALPRSLVWLVDRDTTCAFPQMDVHSPYLAFALLLAICLYAAAYAAWWVYHTKRYVIAFVPFIYLGPTVLFFVWAHDNMAWTVRLWTWGSCCIVLDVCTHFHFLCWADSHSHHLSYRHLSATNPFPEATSI